MTTLLLYLASLTIFSFREDCIDVWENVTAYHRNIDGQSYVNVCEEWMRISTISHELGHTFWYTLTDEERLEYIDLYINTDEYISNYAKTDVKEDFSEMVKYITIQKLPPEWIMSKNMKEKINFIERFY